MPQFPGLGFEGFGQNAPGFFGAANDVLNQALQQRSQRLQAVSNAGAAFAQHYAQKEAQRQAELAASRQRKQQRLALGLSLGTAGLGAGVGGLAAGGVAGGLTGAQGALLGGAVGGSIGAPISAMLGGPATNFGAAPLAAYSGAQDIYGQQAAQQLARDKFEFDRGGGSQSEIDLRNAQAEYYNRLPADRALRGDDDVYGVIGEDGNWVTQ